MGFSLGTNIAEAVNFGTVEWFLDFGINAKSCDCGVIPEWANFGMGQFLNSAIVKFFMEKDYSQANRLSKLVKKNYYLIHINLLIMGILETFMI